MEGAQDNFIENYLLDLIQISQFIYKNNIFISQISCR